eukprot:1160188-Pelagomonas_calceolata.AAC.1
MVGAVLGAWTVVGAHSLTKFFDTRLNKWTNSEFGPVRLLLLKVVPFLCSPAGGAAPAAAAAAAAAGARACEGAAGRAASAAAGRLRRRHGGEAHEHPLQHSNQRGAGEPAAWGGMCTALPGRGAAAAAAAAAAAGACTSEGAAGRVTSSAAAAAAAADACAC